MKQLVSLADILPDRRNANAGTERGRGMLERSLSEAGAGRSILVDKHGKVIAGNKTLEAWASLAYDADIQVIHSDGQRLIIVQRDDLDLDDPDNPARKLAYYDNRTAEIDLSWDTQILDEDLDRGMDFSGLWSDKELAALLHIDGSSPKESPIPPDMENMTTCPACGYRFR